MFRADNQKGFFRRRIVFGVFSGWGAQLLALLLGLVTLPMFFRYLPKDELGVWMFFLGTSFFVNLADFGFSPVLGRHLAFELGRGDRDAAGNAGGASYYFSLARHVAVITAPVLLFGMVLAGSLFIWSLELPDSLLVPAFQGGLVFSLAQAVTCRFKYLETVLNGHGEVGWQNLTQVSVQMASLAGYFLVLHYGNGGLVALSTVYLLRNLLTSLINRQLVRRRIAPQCLVRTAVSWEDVKPHLRPAADMFLISLGTFLVLNTDQYFIVKFLGAARLPDYAAAYRLVQVAYMFAATASAMCAPFISRMSAAGDRSGVQRLLLDNATAGMVLQTAGASLIAVFGDHLLELWLGPGHFVGWHVLWVFCLMLTLENHHVIFANFGLNAKTDPSWGRMALYAGALNLVFTYVGVRWLGLLGIALGTMLAQLLTSNWYAVWKTLSIVQLEFSSYMRGSGIIWLAAGISLLLVMTAIRGCIHNPLPALLAAILATPLIFSLTYLTYRKSRQVAHP